MKVRPRRTRRVTDGTSTSPLAHGILFVGVTFENPTKAFNKISSKAEGHLPKFPDKND